MKKVYDPRKVPKTFTEVLDNLNKMDDISEYEKLDLEHSGRTYTPQVMPYKKDAEMSLLVKGEDFRLDRQIYLDYIHNSREGDVTYKRHNDVNVVFIGPDYHKYTLDKVKNLYKVLSLAKPDLVMVQHKPDRLIDDFKFDEKPKMQFDIDSYINQLVVNGHQIVTSYKQQKLVSRHLSRSGIFVKARYPDETELEYAERIEEMKEYPELEYNERINDISMTTIGLWAQSHNKNIILSDIPDYVFRRQIARHESLIEMRDLLKEA